MRIAQIIGTVTLNRVHPSLVGATLRIAIPLSAADLLGQDRPTGEDLVVYDELAAGIGCRIALSEGGEAAQPFLPADKPVDAYNGAILDQLQMERITIANTDSR